MYVYVYIYTDIYIYIYIIVPGCKLCFGLSDALCSFEMLACSVTLTVGGAGRFPSTTVSTLPCVDSSRALVVVSTA